MGVAADIGPFELVVVMLLTKTEKTRIDALPFILLVSQASLKVAKNMMILIGSVGSKKHALISNFTVFTIFEK